MVRIGELGLGLAAGCLWTVLFVACARPPPGVEPLPPDTGAQGEVREPRSTTPIPEDTATTTVVPAALEAFGTTEVEVAGERLLVAVADTPSERARGLMGVTDLGTLDGMLFVFPEERRSAFWMKDTLIPLDIGFFDGEGAPVGRFSMTPCRADPCPLYEPAHPFRWALEVPAGGLPDLSEGARLAFPGD